MMFLTGRVQNGSMSSEGLDVLLAFHIAQGHVVNSLKTLGLIQGSYILVAVSSESNVLSASS